MERRRGVPGPLRQAVLAAGEPRRGGQLRGSARRLDPVPVADARRLRAGVHRGASRRRVQRARRREDPGGRGPARDPRRREGHQDRRGHDRVRRRQHLHGADRDRSRHAAGGRPCGPGGQPGHGAGRGDARPRRAGLDDPRRGHPRRRSRRGPAERRPAAREPVVARLRRRDSAHDRQGGHDERLPEHLRAAGQRGRLPVGTGVARVGPAGHVHQRHERDARPVRGQRHQFLLVHAQRPARSRRQQEGGGQRLRAGRRHLRRRDAAVQRIRRRKHPAQWFRELGRQGVHPRFFGGLQLDGRGPGADLVHRRVLRQPDGDQ